MSREVDIHDLAAGPVYVGMSSILGISTIAGMLATVIKYGSGGSLEIGGTDLTWGNGYLYTVGEALTFDSAGTIYLAATGATVTAYVIKGKSAGT